MTRIMHYGSLFTLLSVGWTTTVIRAVQGQTVEEVIAAQVNNTLTNLTYLLEVAGLNGTLSGEGPFTVFAPVDTAFAALDQDYLTMLTESDWILHLQDLLLFHVTNNDLLAANLTDGMIIPMLNEENLIVSISAEGNVSLSGEYSNASTVIAPDYVATNGVVHNMDAVLCPAFLSFDLYESVKATPEFSTLASLIALAQLEETFKNGIFTLLAPVNDAFMQLSNETLAFLLDEQNVDQLKSVLLYHAIPQVIPSSLLEPGSVSTQQGSLVDVNVYESDNATIIMFNNANVLAPYGLSKNGIGYAIDTVLMPPDLTMAPVSAPVSAPTSMPAAAGGTTGTLLDVIAGESDLTTLELAATMAEIGDEPGPFTVFAPTDDAFALLDQAYLAMLLETPWIVHLRDLLFYHVSASGLELFAANLTDGMTIPMGNEENVTVSISGGNVSLSGEFFNSSMVVAADLEASNGVLHKVDKVLIPSYFAYNLVQSIQATPELSVLASLITLAGLEDTLTSGTFTVLAPLDEAFNALPFSILTYLTDPKNVDTLKSILLYHVIPIVIPSIQLETGNLATAEGSKVNVVVKKSGDIMFNDAAVIAVDGLSNNGIGYAIDKVLVPTDITLPSLTDTVVDVIASQSDLEVLSAALTLADLNGTLSMEGPYTVFAPNNNAFKALNQNYLMTLLEPEWILHLQDLLLYHVTSGRLYSSGLENGMNISMFNNENVTVSITGRKDKKSTAFSGEFFNDSVVVEADLDASNGVVHKVDAVFIPSFFAYNLFESINASEGFETLAKLIVLANLEEVLMNGTYTVLAPVNEAFAALPNETLQALLQPDNVDQLRSILEYHLIPQVIPSVFFQDEAIKTVQGGLVTLNVTGDVPMFNDALVIEADGLSMNGIGHAINAVLIPPPVTIAPSVSGNASPSVAPVSGGKGKGKGKGKGSGTMAPVPSGGKGKGKGSGTMAPIASKGMMSKESDEAGMMSSKDMGKGKGTRHF